VLDHTSVDILYVNNQHNTILYKKYIINLTASGNSSDYIGTNTTAGFPMVGKLIVEVRGSVTEQIKLWTNTEDLLIREYVQPIASEHLVLIGLPDLIPELMAKALDGDMDIKKAGGYYSGDFFWPTWVSSALGEFRDRIWYTEYFDQQGAFV
jgi:hypothetical protein